MRISPAEQAFGAIQNISMDTKPIYYSVCLLIDQKWNALVLGLVTTCVCLATWQYSSGLTMLASLLLILLTVWYIFLPVRLEINNSGILRTALGRKWLIRWSDIRAYQIRYNGLLLLTQQERYTLDPFCAFFLPVPKGLMTEVLYRFRLFVGE
jgi:hypothetical protein